MNYNCPNCQQLVGQTQGQCPRCGYDLLAHKRASGGQAPTHPPTPPIPPQAPASQPVPPTPPQAPTGSMPTPPPQPNPVPPAPQPNPTPPTPQMPPLPTPPQAPGYQPPQPGQADINQSQTPYPAVHPQTPPPSSPSAIPNQPTGIPSTYSHQQQTATPGMPAPAFNYPPAKKKNKLLFVILGILGILVVGGGVYAALNFVNFGGNNVMKMVKHLEDAGMTCEPVDTVDKFWDSYGEEGRKNLNDAQEAKAEKVYNRYSDQYYECYESDDTQQESPKDVMNPDYLLESLDDVFWRSLFSRSVQETCNSQDSESRDVQQVKEIDFEYLAMNRSVTIEGYISQDVRDKLKEAGVVLEEDVSACSYYEDSSE